MASNWVGGDKWVKVKKWGNGKNNDGAGRRRQGLTRRGRFNPYMGSSEGYPNSPIALRAAEDKKRHANNPTPFLSYVGGKRVK